MFYTKQTLITKVDTQKPNNKTKFQALPQKFMLRKVPVMQDMQVKKRPYLLVEV